MLNRRTQSSYAITWKDNNLSQTLEVLIFDNHIEREIFTLAARENIGFLTNYQIAKLRKAGIVVQYVRWDGNKGFVYSDRWREAPLNSATINLIERLAKSYQSL